MHLPVFLDMSTSTTPKLYPIFYSDIQTPKHKLDTFRSEYKPSFRVHLEVVANFLLADIKFDSTLRVVTSSFVQPGPLLGQVVISNQLDSQLPCKGLFFPATVHTSSSHLHHLFTHKSKQTRIHTHTHHHYALETSNSNSQVQAGRRDEEDQSPSQKRHAEVQGKHLFNEAST